MNIFRDLQNTFRAPSPVAMATQELEEAERSLLEAMSAAEYARRMADYHTDRIHRLTVYLRDARNQLGDRA